MITKPLTNIKEETMKPLKKQRAEHTKPDSLLIPPIANSERLETLLNQIYQKQSEIATLADTILENTLTERQVATMTSTMKDLAQRSLHNCEELELISKSMPSQAN
jgi:hypothetical protein